MAAYGVKWESKDESALWGAADKTGLIVCGTVALTYATGGAMTLLRSIMLGHKSVSVFNDVFDSTKKMAKFSGELLGCSLAIGFPFYSQSVSLLGFSLGCQVIKSALKTLHSFEANNVI